MSGSDPLSGLPVLVTGGAGFIGSHLVDVLLRRGAEVRVLDDFSTGRRRNLEAAGDRIELLEGDLRDPEVCRRAAGGIHTVLHQAALGSVPRSMEDPATSVAVNVSGTANLFAACRDAGVRRIVYASSSAVYGDSERLPKKEGEEGRPLSPYALSKKMDEELAATFGECFGQEIVGLRYFNVFGPRQDPGGPYAAVVPKLFAAFGRGEAPTIHGDGEQSRDFTFVADAVRANLLAAAARQSACGKAYNVAGGRRVTINRLAAAIRRLVLEAGVECPEPVHGPPRPGDVRHSEADLTAANEALGYRPEVGLEEGLRRTAQAFTASAASRT